jgi:transposase
VRNAKVWAGVLGVERSTVIDGVEFDDESEEAVVSVRPRKGAKGRCGRCQRRCPGYDQGEGRRQWRGPDLGLYRTFLEADAPRVTCREHGVVVAAVPWARHDARHTIVFENTVAWMATRTSKSTLELLLRDRLAHRRSDRGPGCGRRRRGPGSAGRVAPDRDR